MNEIGKTTSRFEIDTEDSPVGAIVEFLDTHLPRFPEVFQTLNTTVSLESEDEISQELWAYLQRLTYLENIFMFQFQRKYRKTGRSSDLAVLTIENYNPFGPSMAFFFIEAKRLPTPGSGRKREYVEGNFGGVQRYKKGNHGAGVNQSAIIGYIRTDNCDYWYREINSWISFLIESNSAKDISWDSSDLLNEVVKFGKVRRYQSNNLRIINTEKDYVQIHHYLMELT